MNSEHDAARLLGKRLSRTPLYTAIVLHGICLVLSIAALGFFFALVSAPEGTAPVGQSVALVCSVAFLVVVFYFGYNFRYYMLILLALNWTLSHDGLKTEKVNAVKLVKGSACVFGFRKCGVSFPSFAAVLQRTSSKGKKSEESGETESHQQKISISFLERIPGEDFSGSALLLTSKLNTADAHFARPVDKELVFLLPENDLL